MSVVLIRQNRTNNLICRFEADPRYYLVSALPLRMQELVRQYFLQNSSRLSFFVQGAFKQNQYALFQELLDLKVLTLLDGVAYLNNQPLKNKVLAIQNDPPAFQTSDPVKIQQFIHQQSSTNLKSFLKSKQVQDMVNNSTDQFKYILSQKLGPLKYVFENLSLQEESLTESVSEQDSIQEPISYSDKLDGIIHQIKSRIEFVTNKLFYSINEFNLDNILNLKVNNADLEELKFYTKILKDLE
ncbi:Hypothetical_protein [Hexamita inflata]|uniref:Hypothetical_protein n=1 Tax=Hexamita inflata TaxID=28002 RepID=A0AA86UGX3_9EUKA|nr:Hypothetical protein HINF_LOCUS27543 [Hexamita inflata]